VEVKGLPEAPASRRLVPPFTEEHSELRESIRSFVERELSPHADRWEEERWFPDSVIERMGELGFLGLDKPEEYGGQGGDAVHEAVLAEELARCGSAGLAAGIGAHVAIATPPVWKFGTEDQRQRYVVPAIKGERIAALGITEPDAGTDVEGDSAVVCSLLSLTIAVRDSGVSLSHSEKGYAGDAAIREAACDTPGCHAGRNGNDAWAYPPASASLAPTRRQA
jgi:hypothetical protein